MDRKPFMRWGRFYNNSSDRIFYRIISFIRVCCVVIKHRFIRNKNAHREKLFCSTEWVVKPSIQSASPDIVITWIGHASFLVQFEGINILIDPVFFEVSRFFKRKVKPAVSLQALPKIDVILISHNHRDHLDIPSLLALKKDNPRILVPLGNKRFLDQYGFANVEEFAWWQHTRLSDVLTYTFLPASHWTSRGLFDINTTLWGSWMIQSQRARMYFAGDSAYADHFAAIRKMFAPIDIAFIPIGPNEPRHLMNDAHMGVDQAIQAFCDLGARHFIPMHWGTFRSGLDCFPDLVDHLDYAWNSLSAKLGGCKLHIMKFGESKTFALRKKDDE